MDEPPRSSSSLFPVNGLKKLVDVVGNKGADLAPFDGACKPVQPADTRIEQVSQERPEIDVRLIDALDSSIDTGRNPLAQALKPGVADKRTGDVDSCQQSVRDGIPQQAPVVALYQAVEHVRKAPSPQHALGAQDIVKPVVNRLCGAVERLADTGANAVKVALLQQAVNVVDEALQPFGELPGDAFRTVRLVLLCLATGAARTTGAASVGLLL